MLRNLFRKNKKINNRNLFEELFPLTFENKTIIESKLNIVLNQIFDKEIKSELKKYSRNFGNKETIFKNLIFNSLNWEQSEESETEHVFRSRFGDLMIVQIEPPESKLEKGKSYIETYRNWIRNIYVQQGGGLIMCNYLQTKTGIEGYESITKVPRHNIGGVDYTYFLNLNNYIEQKIYLIIIKILEMPPTGLRDNIMMHPISNLLDINLKDLSGIYQKDPYDDNFKDGLLMNISERKEFDYLFPFHPLSIIRNKIRPILLDSLRFKE